MTTIRERLYGKKDLQEIVLDAVLGKLFGTGTTPDLSYKVVFGETSSLAADTESDVWPTTTSMDTPAAAETLSVVSSSIQDDNGGTGIDAVFIEGLDGDFNPITELVILDGTTPSTSTSTFIHVSEINCLNVTTSGTTNDGNITITNSSSGDTLGYVAAGNSISEHGQFLVPEGYTALLLDLQTSAFRISGASGIRTAEVDLHFIPLDGGAGDRIVYKTIKSSTSTTGVSESIFTIPLVVNERTLIRPTASVDTANTVVAVHYDLILVKGTVDIDSIF